MRNRTQHASGRPAAGSRGIRCAGGRLVAGSALLAVAVSGAIVPAQAADGQSTRPGSAVVAGIDDLPRNPGPWAEFDWTQRAKDFDDFLYDWTDRGPFTTVYEDPAPLNMPEGSTSYKIPAYYGDTRVVRAEGEQESVSQIASVIGASLVGIDKSDQDGRNYVDMLRTFYHPDLGVARNTPSPLDSAPGSQSMWYATTANVLYAMLGALYPDATDMESIQRSIADKHYEMLQVLGGPEADLTMQDFDFATMTVREGRNEGGDVASGTAAILLWAHERFGDAKYLEGAKWAMDYLDRSTKGLYYEMLPLLAPYVAARLNAEAGTDYDVEQMFAMLRAGTDVRGGWGIMEGQWDGFDVQGLSGARHDFDGYAFAMNSFATPWLAATAKYDTRFADAVGLWMLNVYNAGRYFYADQMPAAHLQDGDKFREDPAHVIAYEGIRHRDPNMKATSDVHDRSGGWGLNAETTDLGIYGSSWVGWMGGTVTPTTVDKVLRTDLDALDHYSNTYPTALYYNPHETDVQVDVPVDGTKDLFDSVTGEILADGVSGTAQLNVPAGSSVVLVTVPAGGELTQEGHTTSIDGVAVHYDRSPERDLALGAQATASSSADGAPSDAVDGDTTTAWTSDAAQEQSIRVDLGLTTSVSEVTLDWADRPTGQVRVETSVDGSTWDELGATVGGAQGTFTAPVRDAAHVRVTVAAGTGAQALRSLEVHHRDLAYAAPVSVSSTANSTNLAAHLTDGSDFTRWESESSDPQWAQVDLGEVTDLGSVTLRWEAAAAKSYELRVSDDGEAWETAYATTDGRAGLATVELPEGISGRYVRMHGTQRATGWAYSLYGMEVYAPSGVPAAMEPEPEPTDPDPEPTDPGTDPGAGPSDPGSGGGDPADPDVKAPDAAAGTGGHGASDTLATTGAGVVGLVTLALALAGAGTLVVRRRTALTRD